MKKDIHPKTYEVEARCTCGNTIATRSTMDELKATICSSCHPFFTGDQKFVDEAGRIEKFEKRYQKAKKK